VPWWRLGAELTGLKDRIKPPAVSSTTRGSRGDSDDNHTVGEIVGRRFRTPDGIFVASRFLPSRGPEGGGEVSMAGDEAPGDIRSRCRSSYSETRPLLVSRENGTNATSRPVDDTHSCNVILSLFTCRALTRTAFMALGTDTII